MSKNTYLKRKEQGLCTKCGGEIEADRKGKTTCYECSQINVKYKRETAEFCRNNGICPRCHRVKLIGNEKNCPECSAKNYAYLQKQLRENPETIERREEQSRIHKKDVYTQRKQNGLCTCCGKPLGRMDYGALTCLRCREKHNSYKLKSQKPRSEYKSSIWKSQGLCPCCGQPLYKNHGLCKKHYDMQITSHDYSKSRTVIIKYGKSNMSNVQK